MMKVFKLLIKIIITALIGFLFITCDEQKPVEISIRVNPGYASVMRGRTRQFTAAITGFKNIPKDVRWSIVGQEPSIGSGTSEDPFLLKLNTWKDVPNRSYITYFKFIPRSSTHYFHINYDGLYPDSNYIEINDNNFNYLQSLYFYKEYCEFRNLVSGREYYIIIITGLLSYSIAFNSSPSNSFINTSDRKDTFISQEGELFVARNETRETLVIQAVSAFDENLFERVNVDIR